ncbi:6014_t:CDS:2, partial [Scutellospora calospora]
MRYFNVQTEGLVRHLQNDHSLCWPEVCWIKENPELALQQPTLENYSINQINEFQKMIKTIFHLPAGQERLLKNSFYPSFGDLIKDFEVINKCQECYRFEKKHTKGLCNLCNLYINIGLQNRIINHNYQYQLTCNLNESLSLQENFMDKIKLAAKNIYGFKILKVEQELVINHYAINQKDTFFLMRTGGGKSLCFILPAILFDGLTIVISSLTALMKDQVAKLTILEIPSAALYTSSFETKIREEKIFEEVAMGFLKILYVTPEKIEKNTQFKIFLNCLYDQRKLRLVIDEAHYAWSKLGSLKLKYPEVPLLLLTATASSTNIETIRENLNIKNENFEIVRGINMVRHEISYQVINKKDKKDT